LLSYFDIETVANQRRADLQREAAARQLLASVKAAANKRRPLARRVKLAPRPA
jgi:hypothetical protein